MNKSVVSYDKDLPEIPDRQAHTKPEANDPGEKLEVGFPVCDRNDNAHIGPAHFVSIDHHGRSRFPEF